MSYVEDCGEHVQLQPKKWGCMICCDCGSPYCRGQVVLPWDEVPAMIGRLLTWAKHYGAIVGSNELEMLLPASEKGGAAG